MKTAEIRQKFLTYFESHGHAIQQSASLVPHNDNTLLFVNSGMVPFKDIFTGATKSSFNRAVSCQRCVRAGGKHNDLDNVGYTARHHTFFEMLGNFSFGDYFKSEAIRFAWSFLTEEIKLPKERLWVSIYKDDDEAFDIWVNEIGFPADRISRCGEKDNFWQMGDTGPCGPCSEIFYDHGEHIAGGPPGTPEEDGDRFIEIWNLVFMQFERQSDGELEPLKSKGVDTGMGLERLAAVMQHENNNYDIDSFKELTKDIVKLTPKTEKVQDSNASVRVIADHIRSTAFMVVDGIIPSNEGRGYVLRRIIRRAIRHGHKLGINKTFFYKLVSTLAKQNKSAYPELISVQSSVEKILKKEEERFAQTLDIGMDILNNAINELSGEEISGELAFKLYDTYGFPVDLTADVARERYLTIDMKSFETEMMLQKQRARKAGDFDSKKSSVSISAATEFLGYELYENKATVKAVIRNNKSVNKVNEGEEAIIVLDKSSFYGESGGQSGDHGSISIKGSQFQVSDTQKQTSNAFEHYGIQSIGSLKVGDKVEAKIDLKRRKKIMNNHSATHLLHEALRQILGDQVHQKGSLVESDKLRFDFSHDEVLSRSAIDKIELLVNEQILGNSKVTTEETDIDSAKNKGAMALFGEKYGDLVRLLTMGDENFSVELCGGTHVERLGDIGRFKIISESGISSGIRRIEAITGIEAYELDKKNENDINQIVNLTKSSNLKVTEKVKQLISNQKTLEKQLATYQKQLAGDQSDDLIQKAIDINGVKVLATEVTDVAAKDLRDLADKLKDKLGSAVVVLASISDNKVSLVSSVTKNLTDKYQAGSILNHVAIQIGGKGGGRADMAQGGGTKPKGLPKALSSVKDLI
ncbi:alanine--tRNA ligase [Candidatus Thioglobus sp. NP1]|uniref:alanine--tRNA ligase n=1 Tax=Candidatus Thioglobus sp. NP1 TaxID=2508687 RepID=UPI000DEDD27E|nr:alanine--tRNA ligase [Candidatus Thioglobus sp. NP1]AXE61742.1 alanine--tRNA ligase [Candidatus Thioglobus sp. NP1]